MSDILIKNLKMPIDKAVAVVIHPDGTAYTARMFAGVCTEYLSDCTAVFVPPHGRLIDADALEDNNITYYAIPVLANVTDGAVREAELVIRLKDLDNAPTVIPANGRKIK